jgi:hypothetical protein
MGPSDEMQSLKKRWAEALATFVRIELELAQAFFESSVLSTTSRRRVRLQGMAYRACDEANKWVSSESGMTLEDRDELKAALARVEQKLRSATNSI